MKPENDNDQGFDLFAEAINICRTYNSVVLGIEPAVESEEEEL